MAGPIGAFVVIVLAHAFGVTQNVVWAPTTPLRAVMLIAVFAPLVVAGSCIVRYPAPELKAKSRTSRTSRREVERGAPLDKAALEKTVLVKTARISIPIGTDPREALPAAKAGAPRRPVGPLFRVAAFLFGPLLLGYGTIYGGVYAVHGIVGPASRFANAWGGPTVLGAEAVHEAALVGMALLGWFLLRGAVRGRRRPTNI